MPALALARLRLIRKLPAMKSHLPACLSAPLVAAPGDEAAAPADAAALQTNRVADFARSLSVDAWLRHPVYGDPSFDAFERLPENPIHRGAPPFEWPVNGFLFHDPVGGHDYVSIGCGESLRRKARTFPTHLEQQKTPRLIPRGGVGSP